MTIAKRLTEEGYMPRIDAYRACEEVTSYTKKKEGTLELRVFTFEDGSSVEFCESDYWVVV